MTPSGLALHIERMLRAWVSAVSDDACIVMPKLLESRPLADPTVCSLHLVRSKAPPSKLSYIKNTLFGSSCTVTRVEPTAK